MLIYEQQWKSTTRKEIHMLFLFSHVNWWTKNTFLVCSTHHNQSQFWIETDEGSITLCKEKCAIKIRLVIAKKRGLEQQLDIVFIFDFDLLSLKNCLKSILEGREFSLGFLKFWLTTRVFDKYKPIICSIFVPTVQVLSSGWNFNALCLCHCQ